MQNKKMLPLINRCLCDFSLLKNVKFLSLGLLFFFSISHAQTNSLQANIEFSVYKGVVQGQFVSFAREDVMAPKVEETKNVNRPGDFKIEIIENKKVTRRLFFSSLAAEWAAMCHDDSCKKQIFNESFRLTLPAKTFVIRLKMLDAYSGKWRVLDSAKIEPNRLILSSAINYQQRMLWSVPSAKVTSVAFIPDGYGQDSLAFYADCKRFTEGFLKASPFDSLKQFIQLKALFFPSDTASICTFQTLGIPRYLSVNKRFELARRLAGIQADHIVVISKTEEYGGSGFYNNYAVVSSSNRWSIKVLLHEFGHSFGGLGDEYVTDTAFCVIPQAGVDCAYPNVSSLPNGKVKWAKFIKKSTPVPTPVVSQYKYEVGVYEGASYCPRHLYRPYQKCLMRELAPGIFCPVCREAVVKRLLK
jgi:hypothetical protein